MAIATTTPSRRSQAPRDDGARKRSLVPYTLLLPAVIILLFGMGYPVIWQFYISFHKYGALQQLGGKPPEFVWFDNFVAVATNPSSGPSRSAPCCSASSRQPSPSPSASCSRCS